MDQFLHNYDSAYPGFFISFEYLDIASYVLFAIMILELIFDFFTNQKRDYRETASNFLVGLSYEFFNHLFSRTLIAIGLFSLINLQIKPIPIFFYTWPIAILAADFSYYWAHRLEHRSRIFWAHHSVHHSSTDFNFTTALRVAWQESLVTWIYLVPFVLIGFHPFQLLISYAIIDIYQTWTHTQKIKRMPEWIENLINTPSNHRVHHGSNPQYIDKNYGAFLMIWDRLFGTYEKENEKVIFGLTKNINSINPFIVNFNAYFPLFTDLKKCRNFKSIFKCVLGPPSEEIQSNPLPPPKNKNIIF
jgi:sterol desaturase/sphingolipid hydroxylase (fatty acid hydroxylase superfamily)